MSKSRPFKKLTPNHTLGRRKFVAISAVEGLVLSIEGKRRIEDSGSLESRRAEVVRAYVDPKR